MKAGNLFGIRLKKAWKERILVLEFQVTIVFTASKNVVQCNVSLYSVGYINMAHNYIQAKYTTGDQNNEVHLAPPQNLI